jgi:hypothetical protein
MLMTMAFLGGSAVTFQFGGSIPMVAFAGLFLVVALVKRSNWKARADAIATEQ